MGHIEDIAVDKAVQGKRLGFRVVTALTEISESLGAYKTILDCSEDNIREWNVMNGFTFKIAQSLHHIAFYVKCGYKRKETEMVRCSIGMAPVPHS